METDLPSQEEIAAAKSKHACRNDFEESYFRKAQKLIEQGAIREALAILM